MAHSLYAAIPIIMDRFDFEKVERVMKFLDWTWGGLTKTHPTVNDLKSCALELLTGCVQMFDEKGRPERGMVWSTGGFIASVTCFENAEPQLNLVFYVDHAYSTGEY